MACRRPVIEAIAMPPGKGSRLDELSLLMEEQIDQYQNDSRNAEYPCQEIFAHDRAPFKLCVEYGSIVP
jgi:hypothetical protein